MKRQPTTNTNVEWMPPAWRFTLVALCTLILCSCRVPARMACDPVCPPPALPCDAFSPVGEASTCPAMASAVPCPAQNGCGPAAAWTPSGISRPWPHDEYLADGGDRAVPVAVNTEWEVGGLDAEDTIAHFDTLDGRTLLEPSNRVCIYAPRFGSVRKVLGLVQEEQALHPGDVHLPTQLVRYDETLEPTTSKQQIQPGANRKAEPPIAFRTKQGDGLISAALGLSSFADAFKPYENLSVIRDGMLTRNESAGLARGVAAAIVWSTDESVQVILDHQRAAEDAGVVAAQKVFTVDQPPAHPKLRIVKVASTQFAQPGDVVDFTIRFDNVGNQPIGNVTILDSLSTRLEYVADTAQSSLEADFRAEPNQAGSEVLRWEIRDPLPRNQGGILRFRCRVR